MYVTESETYFALSLILQKELFLTLLFIAMRLAGHVARIG
jgi:hypothetical protein